MDLELFIVLWAWKDLFLSLIPLVQAITQEFSFAVITKIDPTSPNLYLGLVLLPLEKLVGEAVYRA